MQFEKSQRLSTWPLKWAVMGILWALVGCPQQAAKETTSESLPFAGQEISIGVPPELGIRAAWEAPLNEWEAQSGAKYHLKETPKPSPGESIAAFSEENPQTLAFFPLERAGELIAAGCLAPIPEDLQSEGPKGVYIQDLFQGLRDKIASRKSEPMFVPLAAPVLVLYYRQDLLEDRGLNPPQTWDDYQKLLDKLERWAPGCTAVEPWSESFRATMFLARAVSAAQHPGNYSLYFDIDTGEPLIDGPPFVKSLEAARKAIARMPPEVLKYDPAACYAELAEGRAALAIALQPDESPPASTAGSGQRMKVGVSRLPGSREVYDGSRKVWEMPADKGVSQVTLTAFSGWGIGASATASRIQIEAAWNALLKVSGPDFVSGFPRSTTGLCRESQLHGGTVNAGLGLNVSRDYIMAMARSLRDTRLVAELPVAGRNEFRLALSDAVQSAIDGKQTPEEALQSADAAWRKIIDRIGQPKHRDNYRSSLGLSPKPKN